MSGRIEVHGLGRDYRDGKQALTVLDDVDLLIEPHEFVAITGPSGSGKSTLLGLMAGLDRPTRGEVVIDGTNITGLSEDALSAFRGRRIGFVFQTFQLIPTLTALENVRVPAELLGDAGLVRRASELLERVGLADRARHYPSQLSGGEMQRVALARATINRPTVLLADEPTGNLDAAAGELVLELLLETRAESTLVMVTHNTELAARAGREICMRHGRVDRVIERRRERARVIPLRTVLHLARAETRRARGTLAFCMLSISLGVMAITAIRTLTGGLRSSIEEQGQRLLGADLLLQGSEPLDRGAAAELGRDLVAKGARAASSVRFYSMLARAEEKPGARATQLIRARAIGDGFPFYGSIESVPPGQFAELGEQPSVLVDPGVARSLGLRAGDRVRLGQLDAVVLGEIVKAPGSPAAEFSMAPYVFLHERFVSATGLLVTGSRIQYEKLFALPPEISVEAWKDQHWDAALEGHLTLRTSRESAANVRRFLTRVSGFMTVVGLVTLFLGALGIGSAMHAFMRSKLDHAAILRCLGATSRDLFWVYSALALGVAGLGSTLGAAAGAFLPLLFAGVSEQLGAQLLPTELSLRPSLSAALHGASTGLVATFAFTLLPIFRTAAASPLRVLGRAGTALGPLGGSRRAGLVAFAAALSAVFVLSVAETDSARVAVIFTLAIAAALLVLFALAYGIVRVARRLGPGLPSFHLRQGVANLERPGNQTSAVIVALGLGFVLLGTLLIFQRSLEGMLAIEERTELPNLFVIDIQPEQQRDVATTLTAAGAEELVFSPMISARIASINDRPVDQSRVTRDEIARSWEDRMRTREYFVSYRSELLPSETLTRGAFWSGRPATQEVSLDSGMAQGLGVELGDTIRLDIGGLALAARVTSFRDIRWQALRPNAMILLSPGEIEAAPKMFVASLRLATAEARQALQTRLVDRHPNLTVVDATEAAETVLLILSRVSKVLTALGALGVLVGAVILAGAVAAGRHVRQREAMLFKVLGASRADLRRILGAEYAALAVLGTLSGWLLAEVIGRAAVPRLFETAAVVPYAALGSLALGALVLNTLVGLLVGRRVSSSPPLSILREE